MARIPFVVVEKTIYQTRAYLEHKIFEMMQKLNSKIVSKEAAEQNLIFSVTYSVNIL